MNLNKQALKKAIEKALEAKGKRKFTQSVELVMNFKGIDFSKTANRLNIDVVLPKGLGKKNHKVVVFAEDKTAGKAKESGADLIITPDKLTDFAKDKKNLKLLVKDHVFLSEPKLMGIVAKNLGQFLGVRGKAPKPLIGNIEQMISNAKKAVRIVTKGKYLPVLQCLVGSEDMSADELSENAEAVLEKIVQKTGPHSMKSVYFKTTMGKPAKVE